MAEQVSGISTRFMAAIFLTIGLLVLPSSTLGQDDPAVAEEPSASQAASDMVFVSGEDFIVTEATSDDLFAAGGTVNVDGAQADHLFLAGGEISVSEANVSDLVVIGGEIELRDGSIEDDIVIGGGEIIVAPEFGIGGSAVIAGGTVRLGTPVPGDLRIGAGDVYVNSAITGDARLSGEKIVLGPNARIGGDLFYRSEDITIDPAAVIEGERTVMPMTDRHAMEDFGKGAGQFFLLFGLSILVSYFVLVTALVVAVPRLMRATSDMIRTKPLQSLGIGVLYAFIVPVLAFLLFSFVIAAPLAVLVIVISIALTPIALAVTSHFIGVTARDLITKKPESERGSAELILWPILGVVILFGLTLIPVAGLLVWLLAVLFGLGAFAKQAANALASPAPERAAT